MALSEQKVFAHMVYFTLKEKTPEMRDRLVAACHEYLTGHPGTIHFSAGSRAVDYDRSVNDQEFDVALVLVFDGESSHDQYQVSDRHQQFIAEQNEQWAQVRVFDALT